MYLLHLQGRISQAIYEHESRQQAKSLAFMLASCSAYSALKMEAICSSETSVDFSAGFIELYPRR
jgi:hypothetical protein